MRNTGTGEVFRGDVKGTGLLTTIKLGNKIRLGVNACQEAQERRVKAEFTI